MLLLHFPRQFSESFWNMPQCTWVMMKTYISHPLYFFIAKIYSNKDKLATNQDWFTMIMRRVGGSLLRRIIGEWEMSENCIMIVWIDLEILGKIFVLNLCRIREIYITYRLYLNYNGVSWSFHGELDWTLYICQKYYKPSNEHMWQNFTRNPFMISK